MGSIERVEREKAERRKQREELILSAAEQLFLAKGFIAATVSEIAEACEFTNGAIYLYYKNKDELVLKVMSRISMHFGDLLQQKLNEIRCLKGIKQLESFLNVYNFTYREYRAYHLLDAQFNIMFSGVYPETTILDEYFEANTRVLDITESVVSAGVEDGSIHCSLSVRRTAGMLLNAVNSYIEKISLRKELMEAEQGIKLEDELEAYIKLLLKGLSA